MADETAAPAAPAPEAPAQPVTHETFADAMRRHGHNPADDLAPAAPKPAEAAEAEPEATAEPKPKVVTVDPKLDQLKALAQELGYAVDADKVTVAERAQFREAKRKRFEELTNREKELIEKVESSKREHEAELKFARDLKQAREVGDLDGMAKALGWKDYSDMQSEAIQRFADPNYKRLRELEQKTAEREAAEAKRLEEAEKREKAEQQNRVVQNYLGDLSKKMADSKDPVIKAFADNPEFAWAIYQIQCENWDGEQTVTPEQALKMASRGASRTVQENLKAQYERLAKAFGPPEQPKPKVIPPKTKVAATPRAEAAAPGKWNDPKDFFKSARERLAQAVEDERRNGTT